MSSLHQVPYLASLVKRYALVGFVETGADEGSGLRTAKELGLFPRFSCDLNAPKALQIDPELGTVFIGKSIDFLKAMPKPDHPALYWLDAHFPDVFIGGEWTAQEKWPVPEELAIIKKLHPLYAKSVIVCDDIQAIQDPENPVRARLPDTGEHDWREVAGTIKEMTDMFSDTHNATLHKIDTGILVLEPK